MIREGDILDPFKVIAFFFLFSPVCIGIFQLLQKAGKLAQTISRWKSRGTLIAVSLKSEFNRDCAGCLLWVLFDIC